MLLRRLRGCLDRLLLRDLAPAQHEERPAVLLGERRAACESARMVLDTDEGNATEIVGAPARRLANGEMP